MSAAIAHIIELESQRIRATLQRDVGALDKLLADDFFYIHSSSAKDNKQSFINAMLSGALVYRQIETTEVEGFDLGDTIVLTGKAALRIAMSGRRHEFSVRFTCGYVRRGDDWRMQFWQSTRLPER